VYLEYRYFPTKGFYLSGDGCRRDADGYFWITGRVDDVINTSGHRVGTAEVREGVFNVDAHF
jgi:acetyl-CoA synthetase